MSVPPPPLPVYNKPKKVKRVLTREEAIDAEVRHNVIGAVVFLTLTFLVIWGSHRRGGAEVINEIGSFFIVLGDAILFILCTIEPFITLRRRKATR